MKVSTLIVKPFKLETTNLIKAQTEPINPPRQSEPEVNHLQISNLNQNEKVEPLKPRFCSSNLAQTKPLLIVKIRAQDLVVSSSFLLDLKMRWYANTTFLFFFL